MTNLPITASTAQTASPGKPSSVTADSGESSAQPFGEVLARQISAPEIKIAKRTDKLAVELSAQAVTETSDAKKDDKAVIEVAGALPTDMLAALMPQMLNTTGANSAAAKPAANRTDTTTAALADKPGRATARTELTATLQATDTAKDTPPASGAAQPKDPAFTAVLGELSARTITAAETGALARETAASAAQQPSAAALSAMQNAMAASPSSPTQTAQLKIDTPVSQPKWGEEFSQKITWLATSNSDQSAELHLNPPQLGPIDVVIKVSGDQATALFTSPHAAVREAVEQAIPKLRDMMADNGITLGNTTVSDQTPRDQNRPETQRTVAETDNDIRDTVTTGSGNARVSPIARHNGIVDTFA